MATEIVQETADSTTFRFDRGDLRALREATAKWNFRDEGAAIRFMLAVLSLTRPGNLICSKADGAGYSTLLPTRQILKP